MSDLARLLAAVEAATVRRDRLEAHIEAALSDWSLTPVVKALQALRGLALVAAATLMAELGDITRFANPRRFMAYLGLVPSEHSRGRRLGPDRVVDIGTLGTALALFLFAAARDPATALSACLIGGACWTVNLTTLFVSAQVALPDWVRGRGLAMLLTAIFGAMTVGSLAWGQAAESAGESEAFVVAGLCAVLVIPLASRWKLLTVT